MTLSSAPAIFRGLQEKRREIPVFCSVLFLKKNGVLQGVGKITPGYPEPECRQRPVALHIIQRDTSAILSRGNEYRKVPAREKGMLYEAYPMVNCDEPEVVFGTSLA